mgnify:CR=1 FL=1
MTAYRRTVELAVLAQPEGVVGSTPTVCTVRRETAAGLEKNLDRLDSQSADREKWNHRTAAGM